MSETFIRDTVRTASAATATPLSAIALGHPLRIRARLATTAMCHLHRARGRYALCTMCIGVGEKSPW